MFIGFLLLICFFVSAESYPYRQGSSHSCSPKAFPTAFSLKPIHAIAKKRSDSTFPTTVIPPSYNVAIGFALTSSALIFGADNVFAGIPVGLVAALLFFQTGRVRFTFDNEALEVLVSKKSDGTQEELGRSRENFVVGGRNRWKYNTFTNWFFIPSKDFPILMYFKENQTSEKGQVHLFPVIMDGKVLYDTMTERVGSKQAE